MTPTPERRWFRFSLRTLFVVVSLICGAGAWTQYPLHWIREREAVLARDDVAVPVACFLTLNVWDSPPWPLNWFGAEAAGFPAFYLPAGTTDDELARIQRLFPETDVKRVRGPLR
jgi:hypothetical protein